MLRMYLENLKKMILNPIFPIAVFIGMVIYLTGIIYTNDIGTGYSMLSVIFSKDRPEIIEFIGKTSYELVASDDNSYMWMFVPILTSLPYISIISAGSLNSSIRFELIRSSKRRYCTGITMSVITVAGMIITISYILYSLIVFMIMPGEPVDYRMMKIIIGRLVGLFMYGMVNACGAVVMSAFVRNRYLVACIPFMAKYLICMEAGSITMQLGMNGHYAAAMYVTCFIPESVKQMFIMETKQALMTMGAFAMIMAVSYAVYRISMEKRWDSGA